MSLFAAIGISGSGVDAAQAWINTTAGNIANADDTVPTSQTVYASQTPVFDPVGVPGQLGTGVTVEEVVSGSDAGVLAYEPDNPEADREGDVRVANVDIGTQLTQLVEAQNDYQANANALEHATQAYQSALSIGK